MSCGAYTIPTQCIIYRQHISDLVDANNKQQTTNNIYGPSKLANWFVLLEVKEAWKGICEVGKLVRWPSCMGNFLMANLKCFL